MKDILSAEEFYDSISRMAEEVDCYEYGLPMRGLHRGVDAIMSFIHSRDAARDTVIIEKCKEALGYRICGEDYAQALRALDSVLRDLD